MKDKTFRDAALSYIENGGEGKYLGPPIKHFGDLLLSSIHPFDVREYAKKNYPHLSNSSLNRGMITPIRAVINHAHDRGWCEHIRIKNLKTDRPKQKEPATIVWLHLFARQCDNDGLPHLAAIVLFMAFTGARVSEAINLRWSEVDLSSKTAVILKTKTEKNSTRHFPDELLNRLHDMIRNNEIDQRVFRFTSRYSVNERIKAVCKRAGISYKSSHMCGRHTFATLAVEMGVDIPTIMAAGEWRTISLFLGTYVHMRKNSARIVADRFNHVSFDSDI